MEVILENPFLILGLPVTATDRQISKRVDDLSMYCEMGKSKVYDTDFPFLPTVKRTLDSVLRAASQIELPEQKLFHSMFWFWPGNSVDELVFELLKDGNTKKAIEIWEKPIKNIGLTTKSFTNYRNLAILKLVLSVDNGRVNHDAYLDAMNLFVPTINHEYFTDYLNFVSGLSVQGSIVSLKERFADEAYKAIDSIDRSKYSKFNTTAKHFITAFDGSSDTLRQYINGKLSGEHIHKIEASIVECQIARQEDKTEIYAAAKSLSSNAKESLNTLAEIFTSNDMNYKHYADKVANELLQCSTEHFNEAVKFDDSSTPIDQAKEITLWAKSIAASLDVVTKTEDDLSQIGEIKEQLEQSAKDQPIRDLTESLVELMGGLPRPGSDIPINTMRQLPQTLKSFLSASKLILNSIAEIGGTNHVAYIELSDLVVRVVLGTSITYVNSTSDSSGVIHIISELDSFNMSTETENHFNANWNIIKNNVSATKSTDGACYIATLVYGDYESYEVLALRKFRDEVLAKRLTGRLFINFYYAVSPYIVSFLKNQVYIQRIIRRLLNRIVEKVSQ